MGLNYNISYLNFFFLHNTRFKNARAEYLKPHNSYLITPTPYIIHTLLKLMFTNFVIYNVIYMLVTSMMILKETEILTRNENSYNKL